MFRSVFAASAFSLLSLTLVGAPSASAKPTQWAVDASHTDVSFKVTHLVISKVRGQFKDFRGVVTLDDANAKNNRIETWIEVASIDTDNSQRDDHLKGEDFFLASKHPQIHFVSTNFKKKGSGFEVFGKLTMRGVTKPVVLTMDGPSKKVSDPWGGTHRAFALSGKINRQDWGLSWSKTVEGTGAVVSDEVTLEIEVELFDEGLKAHDKKGKKIAQK